MKLLATYARRGFCLFPVGRKTKRPLIQRNLERSSCDYADLISWAQKYPDCNWGLVLSKSGYVAVDVDLDDSGLEIWDKILQKNGVDPDTSLATLRAITGSGGKHLVFKARPDTKYRGKIVDGIHIKHNGYIVIEPSLNSKGLPYHWEDINAEIVDYPEWLGAMIERRGELSAPLATGLGKDYLQKCVNVLKEVELDYEEWVQAGMAIHSSRPDKTGLALYLDLTRGVSYQEGDDETAKAKWAGFSSKGGISARTLGHIIRAKGRETPPLTRKEDLELFRAAAKEDAKRRREESCGFEREGEKLICWNEEKIVDWFSGEGYAYREDTPVSPFILINDGNGKMGFQSMNLTALRDKTAPYFFARLDTSTGNPKTVYAPAYMTWVQSHRRTSYDEIVFRPGAPARDRVLNLWKGIPCEEVDGEPEYILKMIRESLCNNNVKAEWFLDWIAHIVQYPHIKATTVPVLIGMQGTGKGLLMDYVMSMILKDLYISVATSEELVSRFNMHLSGKLLTHIDEATWRGNKTEDGILKNIIGSPTLNVEEKFGARITIDNFSRYIISSNNKEAVAIEIGNRRYCVIETRPDHANDLEWFRPIVEAIKEGDEIKKFYGFLQRRNLSAFDPFEILRGNTDGEMSKIATEGIVADFWLDTFYENPKRFIHPLYGISKREAYKCFMSFSNEVRSYKKNTTPEYFWQQSRKFMPVIKDLPTRQERSASGRDRYFVSSIRALEKSFCDTFIIEKREDFPERDYLFETMDAEFLL